MKKFLLYLLVAVTIQSCAIVHTPGFNSGYKRLTAEEQHKICFVSSVDEIPDHNDGRIMAITADQLSVLLKKHENTLLYLWSPHCSSSVCIPLSTIQDDCDKANLQLYVLTEYYTDALLQSDFLSHTMLSVNEFYYKNKLLQLLYEAVSVGTYPGRPKRKCFPASFPLILKRKICEII